MGEGFLGGKESGAALDTGSAHLQRPGKIGAGAHALQRHRTANRRLRLTVAIGRLGGFGLHQPGDDRVDPDARRSPLLRQALRQVFVGK